MTLTFVPKILAVMLGMMLFGPWMLNKVMFFTEEIFKKFPQLYQIIVPTCPGAGGLGARPGRQCDPQNAPQPGGQGRL